MTTRRRMARQLDTGVVQKARGEAPGGNGITFPTSEGERPRTLKLDELKLSEDVKAAFAYAIVEHPNEVGFETQQAYWYGIRTFAKFAEEDDLKNAEGLDTECVNRYRRWLAKQVKERTGGRWSNGTQGRKLLVLRELVRTVKRGKPELLPSEIIFPTYCYPEGAPKAVKPKRHLTQRQLKSLMWLCQQEIREHKRRFDRGRRILAGKEKESHPDIRHALLAAEEARNARVPIQKHLWAKKVKEKAVRELGNVDGLRAHLGATPRTMTPFVISLLVQLAGNVEPIRNLELNCVRIDEIDERWAIIEWEKARAGPAPSRLQRRFADRTKPYGAAKLIEMVREMTEPHRKLARPGDAEKLFVCEQNNHHDRDYSALSYTALKGNAKRCLKEGRRRIERWNEDNPHRPKEQIPEFDLRDIRGSVAVQHYLESGGDIRRAQQALSHSTPKSTASYIESAAARDKNAQIITEVQKQIVDLARPPAGKALPNPYTGESGEDAPDTATAAFTHECRAPRSESGRLCSHFQQCLDCPGLVIPKTAEHLARLLQAEETFRSAKERLHPKRWEWLYARSYATLTRRILPEFPHDMMGGAHELKERLPPLPDLE